MMTESVWTPQLIVAIVCDAVSGLACAWLLQRLLRAPQRVKERLFWKQLVSLASVDLLVAILCLPYYTTALSMVSCRAYVYSRHTLDIASCLIEIQIAASFMAASFRSKRLTRTLSWCLLFTVPVACGIFWCTTASLELFLREDTGECDIKRQDGWTDVVLASCAVIIALNLISAVGKYTSPGVVTLRAYVRTLSYFMAFAMTLGIKAVQNIVDQHGQNLFTYACWAMYSFNGASNVLNYIIQSSGLLVGRPQNQAVAFRGAADSVRVSVVSLASESSPVEPGPTFSDFELSWFDDAGDVNPDEEQLASALRDATDVTECGTGSLAMSEKPGVFPVRTV